MENGIGVAVAPIDIEITKIEGIGDNNNNNISKKKMDVINVAADEVLNVVDIDEHRVEKMEQNDEKQTDTPAYINPTFESHDEHLPPVGEFRVIPLTPDPPETGLAVVRAGGTEANVVMANKYPYGICCTSDALQVLNRPIVFVICLCMGVIAQGLTVSGISLASLTGIEKQFGLKSAEVALFITVYDTAYGICSLFVGYIGTNHKPRYLGFGLLIMVCGAVLVTIPKFKIGKYERGHQQVDDFCHNSTNYSKKTADCKETGTDNWLYQLIFNIGYLILGFGATPLYTLGPAHIDDVTERGTSSLYLGILYAASAIGPAFGFIISTPLLEEWVELDEPPPLAQPTDQQWVGAWWVGFLIGAGLLLIPVFPMLGFSRIFPDTEQLRAKKLELVDTIAEDRELRMAWPAVKALFKNGPYMCISFAIASEALAIGGFSTFIPKYIENQYNITASKAALYTGLMGIPSAAGGVLLGGYLIKRYEWNCKQILLRVTIMGFLSTIFCAFLLAPCHANESVQPPTEMVFDRLACKNITCNCNDRYNPICSYEDQKTFYSPCYAGCFKRNEVGDNKEYVGCACFPPHVTKAKTGMCRPDSCPLFPVFVVGIFLLVVASFLSNVPMITATFRVVNEGQGSFAMGFQQIFVRFLGFIPSPVMYGALIDRSCKLWQPTDECSDDDDTSNCLEYNNDKFRYYMTILAAVCKLLALMFMFLAYKLYKLPPATRTSPPDTEEVGVDNSTVDTVDTLDSVSTTTPNPPEQGI